MCELCASAQSTRQHAHTCVCVVFASVRARAFVYSEVYRCAKIYVCGNARARRMHERFVSRKHANVCALCEFVCVHSVYTHVYANARTRSRKHALFAKNTGWYFDIKNIFHLCEMLFNI